MENYSRKDFTQKTLIDRSDLNGQTIYNSCFSQETPRHIFPSDMKDVTFINCNLDNCYLPKGNIMQGGSNRFYKVQNDLNDWEIDEIGNPVRIFNHKMFTKLGVPEPKAKDIPKKKVEIRIMHEDPAHNVRSN